MNLVYQQEKGRRKYSFFCAKSCRELDFPVARPDYEASKTVHGGKLANVSVRGGGLYTWRIVTLCTILLTVFVTSCSLRNHLFSENSVYPVDIVKENLISHESSAALRIAEPSSFQWRNSSFVEDVVTFPEEVLLLIRTCKGCQLPAEDYACIFGENEESAINNIDEKEPGLLIVRCTHPRQQVSGHNRSVTLGLKGTDVKLSSQAEYPGNQSWNMLVYEILPMQDCVLLFVKAPNFRREHIQDPNQLACFYGPNLKTRVLLAAQEVVRCELPLPSLQMSLRGVKVSVGVPRQGILPSVARFNPGFDPFPDGLASGASQTRGPRGGKRHFVCACSMIWNQAQFLKEWIIYHGWLGVERWFLYDNNSDDNTKEVIQSLSSFNVSRHPWPWIKTQEAGFSHCALRAQRQCRWVIFIDVDEFIYPKTYLKADSNSGSSMGAVSSTNENGSILEKLILNTTNSADFKVGEIRIDCHSFGPSGLQEHPAKGVTVGYTCRMRAPERHKSIVRVGALSRNLLNVVHHFYLKPGFKYINLPRNSCVINHYKYQVWDYFKRKFVRRVATYITDWQEKQNEKSRDRAPGLGTEPIEPMDWSSRFCQVEDTALRDLVLKTFQDLAGNELQWR